MVRGHAGGKVYSTSSSANSLSGGIVFRQDCEFAPQSASRLFAPIAVQKRKNNPVGTIV